MTTELLKLLDLEMYQDFIQHIYTSVCPGDFDIALLEFVQFLILLQSLP